MQKEREGGEIEREKKEEKKDPHQNEETTVGRASSGRDLVTLGTIIQHCDPRSFSLGNAIKTRFGPGFNHT